MVDPAGTTPRADQALGAPHQRRHRRLRRGDDGAARRPGRFLAVQLPALVIGGSGAIWLFYVQHRFEGAYWTRRNEWRYVDAALPRAARTCASAGCCSTSRATSASTTSTTSTPASPTTTSPGAHETIPELRAEPRAHPAREPRGPPPQAVGRRGRTLRGLRGRGLMIVGRAARRQPRPRRPVRGGDARRERAAVPGGGRRPGDGGAAATRRSGSCSPGRLGGYAGSLVNYHWPPAARTGGGSPSSRAHAPARPHAHRVHRWGSPVLILSWLPVARRDADARRPGWLACGSATFSFWTILGEPCAWSASCTCRSSCSDERSTG